MSSFSGTFTTNAAVIDLDNAAAPITITVIPGSGNSSKCELSTTPNAASNPAAANWQNWAKGTVSAITTDVFVGKLTALRFTQVSGTLTDKYEVLA